MHKFSLVEQAFIKISFLENPKIDGIFDRLIFTSQNAVTAVFSSPKIQKMMEGKRFYCVGKKTASLLAENGQNGHFGPFWPFWPFWALRGQI